jgi:hypothetical protein
VRCQRAFGIPAFIKNAHGDQLSSNAEAPLWNHDERIKAAVIAAPAASYLFGPGDLREVSVPIQLWRVENDSHAPDAWNGAVIRDNLKVIPILTSFKAPITLCFWRPAARPWTEELRKSAMTRSALTALPSIASSTNPWLISSPPNCETGSAATDAC